MKKIFFLLLFTIASYGQAVFDEGIQITGNANSATATKVNVQEANGKVNTQTINTAFNKNFGLNSGDVVGANTLLNQYSTTPVDWTATAFNSGKVVFYGGKQWIAKIATVAGDVPAVSPKWEEITFEALANKTVTVDQTIIDGSTNAVSSNAVFDGLALKSNIGHTHVASQITDLSKASVGLGNVDNTSDLSKPLSTATINALATKAPISSVHNPVTLGTANGLSLATQQLSLGLASSGVTGALSGTDWNTFNSKQPAITGLTTNYLPKWNGSGFGNSQIFDDGSNIKFLKPVNVQSFIDIYFGDRTNAPYGLGLYFNPNLQRFIFYNGLGGHEILSLDRQNNNVLIPTGRVLINKTTDDLTNQLQVAGTITASPATTANQVPTWGQVQALASSGSYTPTLNSSANISSITGAKGMYTKIGNVVTCSIYCIATVTTIGATFLKLTKPIVTTTLDAIGSGTISKTGTGVYSSVYCIMNLDSILIGINPTVTGDHAVYVTIQYLVN